MQTMMTATAHEPELTGAVAHHFLQWLGVLAGGWQWALTARTAATRTQADAQARALLDTAVFYAAHIMPRMRSHEAVVRSGAESVLRADTSLI